MKNQVVSKELTSFESESEEEELGMDERMKAIEPKDEGVLELEDCFEDEMHSLKGLFH